MRTANPVFRESAFSHEAVTLRERPGAVAPRSTTMTVAGTALKTGFLLVLCIAAAAASWWLVLGSPALAMPVGIGGAIVGVILGLIVGFVPKTAPYLAPVYALAEGAFLGVISLIVARSFPGGAGAGIVFQAVLITFGILAALLAGYAFGFVRLGGTATKVVIVATAGVMLTYAAGMIARMLGFNGLGFIHSNGPWGIAFSGFVVVLASLNLVLDFQFIERGAERGAPKFMEWYGAFGLLVTLVWLYVEVLRLLSKLRRN